MAKTTCNIKTIKNDVDNNEPFEIPELTISNEVTFQAFGLVRMEYTFCADGIISVQMAQLVECGEQNVVKPLLEFSCSMIDFTSVCAPMLLMCDTLDAVKTEIATQLFFPSVVRAPFSKGKLVCIHHFTRLDANSPFRTNKALFLPVMLMAIETLRNVLKKSYGESPVHFAYLGEITPEFQSTEYAWHALETAKKCSERASVAMDHILYDLFKTGNFAVFRCRSATKSLPENCFIAAARSEALDNYKIWEQQADETEFPTIRDDDGWKNDLEAAIATAYATKECHADLSHVLGYHIAQKVWTYINSII